MIGWDGIWMIGWDGIWMHCWMIGWDEIWMIGGPASIGDRFIEGGLDYSLGFERLPSEPSGSESALSPPQFSSSLSSTGHRHQRRHRGRKDGIVLGVDAERTGYC